MTFFNSNSAHGMEYSFKKISYGWNERKEDDTSCRESGSKWTAVGLLRSQRLAGAFITFSLVESSTLALGGEGFKKGLNGTFQKVQCVVWENILCCCSDSCSLPSSLPRFACWSTMICSLEPFDRQSSCECCQLVAEGEGKASSRSSGIGFGVGDKK